jgi:KUP system potassium uptake protein
MATDAASASAPAPEPRPPHDPEADDPHAAHTGHGSLAALTFGALGVVYGDIGTSPLYALKESLHGHHLAATPDNVLGVLSLIFWSLTMVVTVKYLVFVMRADNHGEGGILALLALCPKSLRQGLPGKVPFLAMLVVFGAALLYGDGMITPAISVLSAMEGLEVATTKLTPAVLPLTLAILVGLFMLQRRGTAGIGRVFGPIMLLWFVTIGVLGAIQIVKHPGVFAALSPHHAARFFMLHGFAGFKVLGSVVLAVTGGEALYADMGHFGARPIRTAWVCLVMPALVLAYFGQGALVLAQPTALANPFFAMVPAGPAVYALVALATCATVIASQALISGAFSLTHQAVQLGYFPRVRVLHTSSTTMGQVYIPEINAALAVSCLALVLFFQHSSRLAAAYGIAVCGTMAITSIVFYVVARRTWAWPLWKALPVLLLFLAFDLPFMGANLLKFKDGGYVPIFIGVVVYIVMVVWNLGRGLLGEFLRQRSPTWTAFKAELKQEQIVRSRGTGVFMASSVEHAPHILVHHAERLRVLPERSIILTIEFDSVPYVPERERFTQLRDVGDGFYRVIARYGFMQSGDAQALVKDASRRLGVPHEPEDITYYLGRETFLATKAGRMGPWSEALFHFLSRNARPATAYFNLPPEQVLELGTQIDL